MFEDSLLKVHQSECHLAKHLLKPKTAKYVNFIFLTNFITFLFTHSLLLLINSNDTNSSTYESTEGLIHYVPLMQSQHFIIGI